MDDFERPEAPKLGDEEVLQPDGATPTEKVSPQPEAELFVESPQHPASEPLLAQKKPEKKVVLIVLAVVLAVALISGVVWLVLTNKTSQDSKNGNMVGQPDKNENNEDNEKPANEPEPENEIVALSVDDELVQKLYGYFKDHIGYLTYDFYSESGSLSGNISDRMMAALAFQNMSFSSILVHETAEGLRCYDARPVREKAYEIFGKRIELQDGMGLLPGGYPLFVYSEGDDTFCMTGGFDSGLGYHHNLYKAERAGNSISLYVVAGSIDTRGASQEEGFYGVVSRYNSNENPPYPYHPTGDENTDIMEYIDELDKFKWTFVWNGENYVFEKLEQIQTTR